MPTVTGKFASQTTTAAAAAAAAAAPKKTNNYESPTPSQSERLGQGHARATLFTRGEASRSMGHADILHPGWKCSCAESL